MATALDSAIFGPLFTDPDVAERLSDGAFVRALIEVEAALAAAEARVGVIPQSAAAEIAKAADEATIDPGALAEGTARSGFPVIGLVQRLRAAVGPDAAPYVHWGATTQDIMDTACVLQLRGVVGVLEKRLSELVEELAGLARRHRETVMAGRTHGQQALPVTLGLKAAAWLAPLVRHGERLREMAPRLLVLQFGGAAGTLAALGGKGLAVAEVLARELGLAEAAMPWHAQRDGFAEFAGWLSLLTGSLGKMAQDVVLLAQTEVGELAESADKGRGASSTMPQKSNPVASELVLAAARANAALLSAMHQAQIQEHERGTHGWQVEWLVLPQMALLTGGALRHALYLARNVRVDEARMRENIRRANDVVLAEAAVFTLSAHMPRPEAEELVRRACATAEGENRPLIEVVEALAERRIPGGGIDWSVLAAPESYLGSAGELVDAVLKRAGKVFPT
ncbi:MAG TPA: 3-carboxy-cis,cis-muconate cycloisomerase [candidate division Zixibacteria bacterium]|nr:3-carboxy-cis,cis-muconate cycloisomerase [candidate division Zixibacteria bacterium]